MRSPPSRRRLLRIGLAVASAGAVASLAGCSSFRGCSNDEIYLRAELVGNAPPNATVVSAEDSRVAESPWIKQVVEGAASGHPRESSISDCLSDYESLRNNLERLPEAGGPNDRLYYIRIDGQVVRVRAVFFEGDERVRS